jgi:hypothetical protein
MSAKNKQAEIHSFLFLHGSNDSGKFYTTQLICMKLYENIMSQELIAKPLPIISTNNMAGLQICGRQLMQALCIQGKSKQVLLLGYGE